jgi:dTDP-4-amino-4,6-dideoxygalactose transaminase
MSVPLLDLKTQYGEIREEVVPALMEVVESQRFIMGEAVPRLEEAIARLCGVSHAVSCASGTDALLLSMKAMEPRHGDEVITSPFTFFATAGAAVNAGLRPVFADIEPGTFNIDPARVAEAVTGRTRAIVPVHLFGQMAQMDGLIALAERHNLMILEDAAQAIGARRRVGSEWVHAGQLGWAGTFSFFPSKNLGGWGDGGMIVTSDGDRATLMKSLRTHGGAKQYHHDRVGFNSRLDTIQAAILLVKLPHLSAWNDARRQNAARYDEAFADVGELTTPAVEEQNEHVYHQYTVRVPDRDRVKQHLVDNGIGCAVYYPKPLHVQPCFADLGYREGACPEAERASREVLSLPVGPELSPSQVDRVIDVLRGFFA